MFWKGRWPTGGFTVVFKEPTFSDFRAPEEWAGQFFLPIQWDDHGGQQVFAHPGNGSSSYRPSCRGQRHCQGCRWEVVLDQKSDCVSLRMLIKHLFDIYTFDLQLYNLSCRERIALQQETHQEALEWQASQAARLSRLRQLGWPEARVKRLEGQREGQGAAQGPS